MAKVWMVLILLLSGLGVALGAAAWCFFKRPLALLAWGTRRSLVATGLKKQVVETSAGPQTVFVGGTGPLLVLLHGAGDHAGTWAQAAKALAKDFTLVIPDLAGHGDSAPATGPIDAAQIYAGIEAVLTSQAPGQPVTLVGNSLGAWMALVVAHRQPDRVAKVVAVNGGPLLGSNTQVRLVPTSREEARATMAQLRDASSPALPDHVLDDLVRVTQTGPLARFAATAMTMGPWLLTEDQLRDLHTPVRLVWGTADQLMPLDYAQRMVAALPDVALLPIEHCGHVPQQEAPKRFLAALRQALDKTPQ